VRVSAGRAPTSRRDPPPGRPTGGRARDLPSRHREEVSIYEAGGVLQRFAKDFLEASSPQKHPRRSGIPATTCAAAPARACSFRLQDLPVAARRRAQRAMRCCCASSAVRTPTASRSTAWAVRPPHQQGGHPRRAAGRTTTSTTCSAGSIDKAFVDWSGNWATFSAPSGRSCRQRARGRRSRAQDGIATVRIWQANIGKTIVAHVPVATAPFRKPATSSSTAYFPGRRGPARVPDPAAEEDGSGGAMFPTATCGRPRGPRRREAEGDDDQCGHPTVFVNADAIGYTGAELQDAINATRRRS